jgi:CRP-like cAMP-binding protein
MNPHLDKINDFITRLDTETLTALNAISVEKIFKKGDFLLRQDQVCKKSYWIEKGVARKYYLNDGKEITTELYFDNDIAVSFDSYCLQKPSREFIQAITDITLSETDFVAFQTAKKQFSKLATLDLMMTEYYAMWLEDRLFQFHTMDATNRYQKLIEDHPHIIQNIPLTFVASYLGISLETLSRIRAKK